MASPLQIPPSVTTMGDAIRFVREARGLSLRELARRIHVSAPFLSDVEHNRRSTDKLAELAIVLEIPVSELERFDSRMPPDLRVWIASSPGMPSVLREIRDAGLDAYRIRAALLGKKHED